MKNSFKLNEIQIVAAVLPFFIGGFHEFVSCLLSITLLILLGIKCRKKQRLMIKKNDTLLFTIVFVFFYLVSIIWAIDKGVAVLGFIKFLPIFLYLIFLFQNTENTDIISNKLIAYIGAVMTILSFSLHFISKFENFFTVAGRLAGFFQYPNTFALFLLIGLIIIFTQENIRALDYLMVIVLLFGIFESGSRTTFVLTFILAVFLLIKAKNKKLKTIVFVIFGVSVATAVIYSLVTDNFYSVGRFLTTSFKESTFIGRLLYYKDALPVILKHPFGLGYMGYYYLQGSFQTGVYSVMYIHNDFLQILLDIGWIPAILFFVVIFESLFSKNVTLRKKAILLTICTHCLLDFDLQFIPIFIILITCLDYERGKEAEIKLSSLNQSIITGALSIVCVFFGTCTFLMYLNKHELAVQIYPFYTSAQIELMNETEDFDFANKKAESVLKMNKYVYSAYTLKAADYLSAGDINNFIIFENKALDCNKYNIDEYERYGRLLISIIETYNKTESRGVINNCEEELVNIQNRLDSVEKTTSILAWNIKDKPNLKLSSELEKYIENIH